MTGVQTCALPIWLTYPGNLTEGYIVTPAAVAGALERLYRDREHRASLAEAAYQNATRPEFDWSLIASRWKQLFTELLDN